MKIHMAFKGGLVKYPRSSTQGGGGVENTQKSIHMVYGCSLNKLHEIFRCRYRFFRNRKIKLIHFISQIF